MRLRTALVVAGTLRLLGAVLHAREGPVTHPDEANYLLVARALAETGRYATYPGGPPEIIRGPAYPAFLVPFAGGSGILAPLVVQALLGTATVAVVAVAVRRALVRAGAPADEAGRIAPWAALALAVSPVALGWERLLLSEALATTLLAAAAACWMEAAAGRSPAWSAAAGAAFAALALAKPAFLPLPLVLAALGWATARTGRTLLAGLVLVASVLVPVGAWAARNHALTGRLIPVGLGAGPYLYLATLPRGPGGVPRVDDPADERALARYLNHDTSVAERVARDDDFRARALARLRAHPLAYARSCVVRAVRLWASSHAEALAPLALPAAVRLTMAALLGGVVLLAGVGWAMLPGAWARALLVPAAVLLYTTLVHAVLSSGARYSVVAWPFVLALAVVATRGRRGAPA